jgi:hypothetical protein
VAIALVQSSPVGVGTGTVNVAATWPGATQAGNLLVASIGLSLVANAAATVDTVPSGWVLAGDIPSAANNWALIYYIENAGSRSGTETFGLTPSLVNDFTIELSEWSGAAAASSLDQEAEATSTTLAPSSGTTAATAQNDELAVAVIANRNVSTQSAPTNSYTQRAQGQSTHATVSNRVNTGFYHLVLTSTGATSTSVTVSGGTTRPCTGVVVTFKASAPPATAFVYSYDVRLG